MKSMYYWLGKHVHAPYGNFIYSSLFILEILFVPVPISALHIFYCLENRSKTFIYAGRAIIMTATQAFLGYLLGLVIWSIFGHKFVYYVISPENFDYIVIQYKKYQAAMVVIMSAIPFIPFKALTLMASFIKLPIIPFILFCILGRGTKFYLLSFSVYLWGHHVKYYLDKYFYYFMALIIIVLVLTGWLLH